MDHDKYLPSHFLFFMITIILYLLMNIYFIKTAYTVIHEFQLFIARVLTIKCGMFFIRCPNGLFPLTILRKF